MNEANTKPDELLCPKCKSGKVHAEKRGYSVWVGFFGSGRIVLTCLKCGHKFKPGEGAKAAPDRVPVKEKPMVDDDGEIPTYRLD